DPGDDPDRTVDQDRRGHAAVLPDGARDRRRTRVLDGGQPAVPADDLCAAGRSAHGHVAPDRALEADQGAAPRGGSGRVMLQDAASRLRGEGRVAGTLYLVVVLAGMFCLAWV